MESKGDAGKRRAAWIYRILVVALLAGVVFPVIQRPTGDWEAVYVAAAYQLRTGGKFYEWGSPYTYPPFGALVAVPFSFLTKVPARTAWAALNVVAAATFLAGAWRLSGGRHLPGAPATQPVDHAAFWLGTMCAVGFFMDAAANWQTDLLVAAMLVGGGLLLAWGRGLAAGLAFGVAAAFKCTPLLFAPYLLWRRQWLGALAVPVAAIGLNLLPDLAYPPPDGQPRLLLWKDRLLAPMANPNYDPGTWASAVGYNHSLSGVNLRWFAHERVEVKGQLIPVPRRDRMPTTALKLLNLTIAGCLCLAALAAMWHPGNRSREQLAAEIGIVFTLMLLLSPMSSKPHFCTLLLPQLVLVRVGWANRDRFLIGLAVLVGVGGLCTGKDITGRRVYEFLMWNGLVFWLTLALFAGCCYTRFRYGRMETAIGTQPAAASEQRRAA